MPRSHYCRLEKIRRILVLRFRRIGDVIMTTPAVEVLRNAFPEARVDYVLDSALMPLLDENPNIDRLIPYERKAASGKKFLFFQDLSFISGIRKERYDLVIDFHSGPRSALVSLFSGAGLRAGFDYRPRSFAYNIRRKVPGGFKTHSVLNYIGLLEELGIAVDRVPGLFMGSTLAREKIKSILQKNKLVPGRYTVCHITGSGPYRCWPARNFLEFVKLLLEATDMSVVLTGAPGDPALHDILECEKDRDILMTRMVDLVGALNFKELRELVSEAALYVGVDSGPMHIAATTATPMVTIFGPTSPETFGPWMKEAEYVIKSLPCRPCHQKRCELDALCMKGITGRMVFERVYGVLEKTGRMVKSR